MKLRLTFACCRYDRTEGIREGTIAVEGVELTCITLKSGREIFDRMVGGGEFDISELSASEYISLVGRGDCPFVALPVFPSRVFRHGYIFISGRSAPSDIETGMGCGAADYFVKPIDTRRLLERLRELSP